MIADSKSLKTSPKERREVVKRELDLKGVVQTVYCTARVRSVCEIIGAPVPAVVQLNYPPVVSVPSRLSPLKLCWPLGEHHSWATAERSEKEYALRPPIGLLNTGDEIWSKALSTCHFESCGEQSWCSTRDPDASVSAPFTYIKKWFKTPTSTVAERKEKQDERPL